MNFVLFALYIFVVADPFPRILPRSLCFEAGDVAFV